MFGQQTALTNTRNAERSASSKGALVAAGGGQRGSFTAGVLHTW